MNDFKLEGIGKLNGGTFGSITVEGVGNCTNDIKVDTLKVEGVFNCSGEVEANYLYCEGVSNFSSNIRAKKINIEGVLAVKGFAKIEAEEIVCEGVMKGGIEISADIINTEGCIKANEIVGDFIKIKSHYPLNKFLRFFNRETSAVKVIEATTIELSGVTADTVNGKDIFIGPECKIETIDCSGSLFIDKNSVVKKVTGNYIMK